MLDLFQIGANNDVINDGCGGLRPIVAIIKNGVFPIVQIGIPILLIVFGLFFYFLSVNLFTLGYSFLEYVQFISRRVEYYLLWIGVILLIYTIKRKER